MANKIEISSPGETRWYYRARTIDVILKNYQTLHKSLEKVNDDPSGWDDDSISLISGLLGHFDQQSSILYAILQGRDTDFSYGMCKVENFK